MENISSEIIQREQVIQEQHNKFTSDLINYMLINRKIKPKTFMEKIFGKPVLEIPSYQDVSKVWIFTKMAELELKIEKLENK